MSPVGGIEASALGQALRQSEWLYPVVKAIHLAGIALLLSTIAVLDLRLLGLRRSVSVKRLAARVLPWSAGAFLLIVPSGLVMFTAHASTLIASPVFALKICLIMGAGVNAALFHAGVFRVASAWDLNAKPPAAARAAAAISLGIWSGVAACGLLLAREF